ncbi:IS110 family transposase [Ginsengibacter hankyongi]|uniref:IS110 family transposase n=1 Tax=Ginsengibacter hankyongi TaxID=2607284 RepID=A0A5J5IBE9_9BACT|nr:IS110 family transposase [Ginsengibacter hankyongi]KAA9034467.1 IS110 family transposase [Ginsengibacter hankyongi]
MKRYLFIGIDISKATLDVCMLSLLHITDSHYHQFPNNTKGFILLLKWLKQKSNLVPIEDWRLCMENTGMYSLELNCFLHDKGIWQTMENALQIKRSMGVVRGKTDKADCKTIALYAYRFFDRLKPYVLPNVTLLRLKALFAQRERLVSMHSQLLVGNQSLKGYPKDIVKDIEKQNEKLLKNLSEQIKAVDKLLKECLKQDEELQRKATLIQSVPGIGPQTAAYLLIVSRGMNNFATPRQFACYSGCAPFAHTSGSSIRGKTKVHFIANRKMKMLLHMAAMNAITFNEEIKAYYQRKVAEGKNPMSVLNAVRFKLICRIFSVVKRDQEFVKEYRKIAA